MNIRLLPVILLTLLLSACGTPKDVVYFQGVDEVTPEKMAQMTQFYSTQICPDDLLTITVSSWDPIVVTPFNPPPFSYAIEGELAAQQTSQIRTYLVDREGYINFPVIGKVHVAGLSVQELNEKMGKEISVFVPDAIVNSQIVNFRVTLLGEVARPGTITVPNSRISIIDAIGRVGDLTINAKRNNILVIRENDGYKEFARIDITRPDLFASPYYYLRQNDVVYIEPNNAKKKNARYSQAQQYNITVFSSVMSALSVITSMVVVIVNNTGDKGE